ncbi:hypothetical protein CKAN_02643200 [Cinnamomum micranthum f. kanehirae]|uniref:Uncharacterized protein n=1 Tax=Cinnamomum micranthum f. kanehirae TaxID=337451 RepID=A0A3S3R8R1_9MAGN|nr:hypothetical protein CKAN_02643200 [Cinnamomum micranthum f. kanehirae]
MIHDVAIIYQILNSEYSPFQCYQMQEFRQLQDVAWIRMVLDSITSPHRRSQNPFAPLSPSFRKQLHGREESSSSWSILFQRHRFLLTMLALLGVLCTIYLYFAVTFGAGESCSGLKGTEAALCVDWGRQKYPCLTRVN